MNIIYICQHFYPEIGAPSIRILELSKEWVKLGHNVTVVTAFPNHPTGKIPDRYRGCFYKTEYHEGIRILRNFIYVTPNKGRFKRILSHLSFMVSSLVLSLPRLGKPDVIIVSSPPFFAVISGFIMSRFKRCPFVFEVRDLWPAAINDLGVVKAGVIIKMLESLELFLYRRAAKVVVVTESFKENLISRGIPFTKIEVIFNGVAPERFTGIDAKNVKRTYGLEGQLVILYSGTHGIAHSLETVLIAAERLRDLSYVTFLFVGEGANKNSLQEMAHKKGLRNVIFWPGQTHEKMPEIYALGDICLVSLKNITLFNQFIPSKIFEIMASGRPIIACLGGEAAKILERSGGAKVIPPENPELLEQAIINLIKDNTLRQRMGENGAQYVNQHFKRDALARQYENVLLETSNNKMTKLKRVQKRGISNAM